MGIRKIPAIAFGWNTQLSLNILLCFVVYFASHRTFYVAGNETFDSGNATGLPVFQCGISGWSLRSTQDRYAIATCPRQCSHNLTLSESADISGMVVLAFSYALNGQDATRTSPVLSVYCDTCSVPLLWNSASASAIPTNGRWSQAEVKIKRWQLKKFKLTFQATLQFSGQVIGLDDIIIKSGKDVQSMPSFPAKPRVPAILPGTPIEYPKICLEEDGDQATQTTGDGLSGTNFPTFGLSDPKNTPYLPDTLPENVFGRLDNETTLLFAQILAILSVSVCFITVGIHCLVWRKQRRLHRSRTIVHLRPKPSSNNEPHDSMLLEMKLEPTVVPEQSASNDVAERIVLRNLKHLNESDILQQPDPRRATVSHVVSTTRHEESKDVSSDEELERPHPRTKSLPGRPIANVYETIDEVDKYQPLVFDKSAAAGRRAPAPGERRLKARARGVQNLAATKKYRPSSVHYEEISNRRHGELMVDEPRDRSKSASHYDYVKHRSPSQGPRRNVLRYGPPRPKGRAPPPPGMYDEPVRRPRPGGQADTAPTILLQNQSSGTEAGRTDTESIPEEPPIAAADTPSSSTRRVLPNPTGDVAYFTLEPPNAAYQTSEDSDDEHESEIDVSRFEDASESEMAANYNIALRPLSMSIPIDIPQPKSPTMGDFEEETSAL